MLKLLAPFTPYLTGATAVALVAGSTWAYHAIYERGWDERDLLAVQQQAAILAANTKAIAIAEKGLREDVALLMLEKEKLEDDVARLNQEAIEDHDAQSGGIGAGSVQRLNSVR